MEWLGGALAGAAGRVGRLEGARLHGAGTPALLLLERLLGAARLQPTRYGALQQFSGGVLTKLTHKKLAKYCILEVRPEIGDPARLPGKVVGRRGKKCAVG
jgi:hypothetical protein